MTDYVLIYPALAGSSSSIFNIGVLSICLVLEMAMIWGCFYIYRSKNQDDVFLKEFKNSWAFVYDCFDKILLLPVLGLCFMNFLCKSTTSCYNTENLIAMGLSAVVLVILIIFESFYVNIFFNFTYKEKDGLSRNPSALQ